MKKPLLRAEAIITNMDKTKILVQCDLDESFYRLPGGTVEFGETAADAIRRELIEEFDLQSDIGELVCVNESIVVYDGTEIHHCTLIHMCFVKDDAIQDQVIHKQHPEVKLTWRTIDQLKRKEVYPEGVLDIITSNASKITHISVQKAY